MEARKPSFCINKAELTPARCAPAEMPMPSSSFARRTNVIYGSSSAIRIRWTSHVSGRADMILTSHSLSASRSEEHTSELQSRQYLVCRLLLEKKKKQQ